MTRPRLRIGSELLPVCLILASLAGTSFLIVSMHRRATSLRKRAPTQAAPPLAANTATRSPVLVPPPPTPPEPELKPEPAPLPAPPVEDPTRTALARLGAEEAEQLLEAQAADRKAEALEHSIKAALAESQRWKRREQLIHSQIDSITGRVRSLEQEADALAMERDVLAQELEASKTALMKARTRSSYAVLPNRAPNGTWRRPIVIECHNGCATLQPGGPTFNLLDLSALLGARSSPILLAVVRELTRIQGVTGPDGAPTVPYIFFVVRPDGIRPFYDARARLESLGIAFGYELVDQDMEIDYPDLDHPDEWDGSPKLSKFPELAMSGNSRPPSPTRSNEAGRQGHSVDDYRWPTGSAGSSEGSGLPPGGSGRRASGGGNPSGSGISLGDLGMPGDRGTSSSRSRGLAGQGRSGDLGREISEARNVPTGSAATPGMLPPLGGSMDRPGMLPTTGGGTGDRGDTGVSAPSGSFAGSGRSGSNHTGSQSGIPFGVNVPGQAGSLAQGTGTASPPPHPEDVSNLDGVSLMGRPPGEGAPFRPRGLLPGEPGAPPEESANAPGVAGQQGGAQTGGPGQSGGQGQSGGPGQSSGQPGGQSGGASGGSGTAASGSSGSVAGGRSGGEGVPSPGSRDPLRIEVPMEIVVACGPSGVVIHPGGYSISLKALKGKDPIFTTSLKTIVRLRQQVDPMIRPKPTIRFLVEPGGGETYRDARRVTVLSGIEWPTVLQVADTRVLDFLPRERF
ncbi:hypothetical protein [Singulisphaera acidiphila]|uniref:Uncharacterized protein n=1 Tax=Singulisphaera acidiphila (strain ATCC BAA-1392 / DSM 18658 / VKM B-2454 / MOB10) TaxID=886293 RepID=L0DNR9_SINAD|nr:hypothetical protein [Singulisphaera acidiphila]AGA30331.1 hypothetical protein Sinac_6233 [Singulisphaera acidiphila DSM 18658]